VATYHARPRLALCRGPIRYRQLRDNQDGDKEPLTNSFSSAYRLKVLSACVLFSCASHAELPLELRSLHPSGAWLYGSQGVGYGRSEVSKTPRMNPTEVNTRRHEEMEYFINTFWFNGITSVFVRNSLSVLSRFGRFNPSAFYGPSANM
jgi:hypothetical protein